MDQRDASPVISTELKQRILDARYSGKLSDCESDVLMLLSELSSGPRAGKENALKIGDMQGIWTRGGQHCWSDRVVKAAVKELIEAHMIPVCSSRDSANGGYFLPASIDDLDAAERLLRGEIISLAKRLRAFNPNSSFAQHLAGQLTISYSAESKSLGEGM